MGDNGLSHEDFFKVFHTGGGFTSGCGSMFELNLRCGGGDGADIYVVEYQQSSVVEKTPVKALDNSLNPDFGLLRSGRRLINIPLRRFSDDVPCELHDVLPATGHYVVLVLLPKLFRDPRVQQQLEYLMIGILQKFVSGIMEPFVIHPLRSNDDVEWSMFPKALKEGWEWNLFGDVSGQGYETLGVDRDAGVVAVLRPDGVLGGVWDLDELAPKHRVENYLAVNLSAPGIKLFP